MSACRRDTLGDSNMIVLAAARPTEQLPLIGWRPPSAASSQAPSSGGTRMLKHIESNRTRKVSSARPEQYDRMIAEGLGDFDKSGIAELTFKDRHKHSRESNFQNSVARAQTQRSGNA